MAHTGIQIHVEIFLPLLRLLQAVHQLFDLAAQLAQFGILGLDLRLQIEHGLGLLLAGLFQLFCQLRNAHSALFQLFCQLRNAHLKLLDFGMRFIIAEQTRVGLPGDEAQSGQQ